MAIAPRRRRAGRVDIENKERAARDEIRKRKENEKKVEVNPQEHEERLKALREAGFNI